MNEPFYIRNSLWVAFVALLQLITPAVVVVAVLYESSKQLHAYASANHRRAGPRDGALLI